MTRVPLQQAKRSVRTLLVAFAALIGLGSAILFVIAQSHRGGALHARVSDEAVVRGGVFRPTPAQWAMLTVQPVELQTFRTEYPTEGKIAVDEDRSTPIFSPYAGRLIKLLVRPGDTVQRGQPLFVVEATDSVQAQNDFMAAVTGLNKARAQLHLSETTEARLHSLYDVKVTPLKAWQEAQANLTTAQSDVRAAEIALEAVRNRLRILGKTDAEIDAFQSTGVIKPESTVFAPLSGTIVQRKVGPGQYIGAGASDPVCVIGDLSTVWLVAYMREADAPKVQIGQTVKAMLLSHPDRMFDGKIDYVSTTIDASSRRLVVHATLDNPEGLLKPEMFASIVVLGGESQPTAAVAREAVIYEGESARVWVVGGGGFVELRRVKTGLTNGQMVQVVEGLNTGDRVITKGSLFIDRAATLGN
jgi:cobalt-zinc-cadmium efflux system membrane fusion protein